MSSTMDWNSRVRVLLGLLVEIFALIYYAMHDYELLRGLSQESAVAVVVILMIVGIVLCVDGVFPSLKVGLMLRVPLKRFKAEIVGKEPFLLGGVVGFKASFRGKLEKGFFTCKVLPPKGVLLPTRVKTHEWWPCYGTFQRIGNSDIGILRGRKSPWEFAWEPKIPRDYPEGEYTVFVGVYESTDSGNECVKEKPFSFHVVDPKNVPSGTIGVSGMLKIIDD